MEIAVKLCALAVYILYLLDIIDAQKPCKVPNGDAGTCINISKCQPLMELSNVKYKTPHENMYFQQSYCGGNGPRKLKVCCPSESMWNKFDPRPIVYPHSPTVLLPVIPITNSPVSTEIIPQTKPPEPVLLSRPATETFGNRMAPEEMNEVNKFCGIDTSSSNKIIGGEEVAIDQYPWLALLEYAGNFLACGGSLISHRFVLTAAHCLNGLNGPPLLVRLAEFNTSSFPTDSVKSDGGGYDNVTVQIVEVKNMYPHPKFNRNRKIHDIGLVELIENVVITKDFIKAICLPERNFLPDFDALTKFTIAGWGGTANASESEVKLELSVPYVSWDKCEKVQEPDIINTQICAGGIAGKDSCRGDSGGPLMYEYNERFYVVGVISYGSRTCGDGMPATHTNVNQYMTWIKETMRIKFNNQRNG
ncbi:phenoloxidase-activating enzyme [Bicyclus anynana]|uniref:CLIP domain-containing serine protease n=1 Tax=Bicyclus anynana TaxID=110368 RepID=A0ABM3M0H2_BICAN|nr:phenoloxidase-activating enzyme [Bicyclus anynana]